MLSYIDYLGFIATGCFAVSAIPQALKSIKDGHSNGISPITAVLWFLGEVCMFGYVVGKYQFSDMFPFINYGVNTVTCTTILYYRFFPQNVQVTK